ncbi:MAG: glycosyltransferase family 1 protein [Boseongicola sp.]|nr:glycosyltransferase [Boseongicola sp.]NNL17734.1 glycosyltransferase family 1 protein [Boseongicola sp.]
MRFLFTSIRGQGHTRPLLPFANAMQARGHDVLIASPEDTRPLAERAGIEFAPFDRMSDENIQAHWAGRQHLGDDEMVRFGIRDMFANRTARTALPKLRETIVSWKPDVVVRDSAEFAAFALSETLGIPHARVGVHNCEVEATIMDLASDPVEDLIAELGGPQKKGAGLWSEPAFSTFPEGFDGKARHGPDNPPFRVNLNEGAEVAETDWAPKSERPLVYISFGTVAGGDMFGFQEVYKMAIEAAGALDAEVLLTTGPNIQPESLQPPPDNVEIRTFVPQAAVLQQASVVMHHGGSGTLSGAFEAGVPMVVVPLFADQPWNATRVAEAGLGVSVTDRSVENLRAALRTVMADDAMSKRCRRVAAEVAELPGVNAAADRLESLAGTS